MTEALTARAHRVREAILAMAASPQGAHVGGSLSAVEILTVLYSGILRVRPADPAWPARDWFILSKGHASAALYAVLADRGFFGVQECQTYAQRGSRLAGHPLRRLPGVDFATGSLGHGLSVGTGLALAAQRTGGPNRCFVLLGDGELQEGSNWEAAMTAAHLHLDNLVAVVDRNGWQITGRTEECMALEPLAQRWLSFGWSCTEVDGHDVGQLQEVLASLPLAPGRPTAIIAHTVKGRGVRIFEDTKKSHYVQLTPRLYQRALASLRAGAPDLPGRDRPGSP
jgi:transketolase